MAVVPANPTDAEGIAPSGQFGVDGQPSSLGATDQVPEAASEPFQILALDGGGAKALFTAHVLARLEQDLGVSISESFDLIAGTSAGGIVALALGAGLAPAQIVEHYEELVSTVFPAARRRLWRRTRQLTSPIYDDDALRTALTNVLGGQTLGDSTKRLVIPAWDVQRGAVHIFKTPHNPRLTRDWRIPMVDIAMATSAAPLYFPAARVDGHRLIDGGVWANNPSVVAIAEAVSMLNQTLSSIRYSTLAPSTSSRIIPSASTAADCSTGRGQSPPSSSTPAAGADRASLNISSASIRTPGSTHGFPATCTHSTRQTRTISQGWQHPSVANSAPSTQSSSLHITQLNTHR